MCHFQVKIISGISHVALPVVVDVDAESFPTIADGSDDVYRSEYDTEISYDVSFPRTENNIRIFGSVLSPSGLYSKRKKLGVFAIAGADPISADTMIVTRNGIYSDGRIEVVFYRENTWHKLAGDKKLSTIEFGTLTHGRGFVATTNGLGPKYVDTFSPFRYPMMMIHEADYGPVDISEQMPWVSPLFLLKKGFSEIGWNFKCPFLESEHGRRMLTWIIADDFNNSIPSTGLDVTFNDELNFIILAGKLVENCFAAIPNKDYWVNGSYVEPVWCDVQIQFTAVAPNNDSEYILKCKLGKRVIYEHSGFIVKGKTELIVIDLDDIVVNDISNLTFDLLIVSGAVTRLRDITIKTKKIHKVFLREGLTYKFKDIVQKDDTLLEYFFGIAQMIFGKVDVKYSTKELTLLTPYGFNDGVDDIEGYYKNEISTRFRNKLKANSLEIIDDVTENKRYANLKFKDTNDISVTRKYGLSQANTKRSFAGIFVDYGTEYGDEIDTIENEYFEPTAYDLTRYDGTGAGILNCGALMLIGDRDGRMVNIGRRVAYAIGVEPLFKGKTAFATLDQKAKFYSRQADSVVPFFAIQTLEITNNYLGTYSWVLPVEVQFLHLSFGYLFGTTFEANYVHSNLYKLLIKKYLTSIRSSARISAGVYMTQSDKTFFSKRIQYSFTDGQYNVTAYPSNYDGYKPCSNQETVVSFVRPDVAMPDPVILLSPESGLIPGADNDFEIEVTVTGCTYLITADDIVIE